MGKEKRERALADNQAMAMARLLRISPQKLNLVAEMIRGTSGSMSPSGRYIGWWSQEQTSWMATSTETGETVNLSENIPHPTTLRLLDVSFEEAAKGVRVIEPMLKERFVK